MFQVAIRYLDALLVLKILTSLITLTTYWKGKTFFPKLQKVASQFLINLVKKSLLSSFTLSWSVITPWIVDIPYFEPHFMTNECYIHIVICNLRILLIVQKSKIVVAVTYGNPIIVFICVYTLSICTCINYLYC